MPSPFPGMDPYLEHPFRWEGFHSKLISEIQTLLTEQLQPNYLVNIDRRVFISDSEDEDRVLRKSRVPDVLITTSPRKPLRNRASHGLAVMEPIVLMDWTNDPVTEEIYLTIVDSEKREAVTIIELLSPTNKTAGTHGRKKYLAKRKKILQSRTHLVEIDLLRAGRLAFDHKVTEYCVTSSVVDRRPDLLMWKIRLDDRLPVISIPLRGKATHAFDLQNAFTIAYDRGGYALGLDYTEAPVPPLRKEWRAWAKKLVK